MAGEREAGMHLLAFKRVCVCVDDGDEIEGWRGR